MKKKVKKEISKIIDKSTNSGEYDILLDDQLISMYSDITVKTNLTDNPSDIITVLLFKRVRKSKSNSIPLKNNLKGSVVISNNGIHIITSIPHDFNLKTEKVHNDLSFDGFNAQLKLNEILFKKVRNRLDSFDSNRYPNLIKKAVAANKDTNNAFTITITQLGDNNVIQTILTDVIKTKTDKKKLIDYFKTIHPQFTRRSITDIYKYYMTYERVYKKLVSKIEKIEKIIKTSIGVYSSSYDWHGWKYYDSEIDGVTIRYNIENQDENTTFHIQILGKQTNVMKKTIKELGRFVAEYKDKKTKKSRKVNYNKIRQTNKGRKLLKGIKDQSKAMLKRADIFMEGLFPMIELSNQSSNRIHSKSGTRVLNDYRIMAGPNIDYDFSTIQNYHITDEVNEIQVKITYRIGYEISFNKRKFNNFRMVLNQEVTRRALILEAFQKNVLTRNGVEELPGNGNRGYYTQLLDIYKSSPGKGWKDILPNDLVYQFYNTRVKQLSMTAGKLSTPIKGWENGRITSTLIQGDSIFRDIWNELKESSKKIDFPSNLFVKKQVKKLIKEVDITYRITDQGLVISDVKSKENILAINKGLQRFQRGNENAGGTELFKEYIERLLVEKRDLLGINGLGLDLKREYSVHNEYAVAKNNFHEDFNYSIGAPDVVIKDKETNEIAAIIQLKGYSQNDSHFNTSISFFQMIEAKLLTETMGIKTAFVHISETVSNKQNTGKLENVRYDWLVFNKTETAKITDLEKAFWHTLIIRQMRRSDFSENIFNDMSNLMSEKTNSFDREIELVINERISEIVEKLEYVKNEILYNDYAQGFDKMIFNKYFNGVRMTDIGVNEVHKINQNNILGSIDKNALRGAIRNEQSSFQYQWNKTILLDCWERQIIELLKKCTNTIQNSIKV